MSSTTKRCLSHCCWVLALLMNVVVASTNPTQGLLWSVSAPAQNAGVSSGITYSVKHDTFYYGAESGAIYCRNLSNPGAAVWFHFTAGAVMTTPALDKDENTLFVGSQDGTFYAFDAVSGTPRWQYAAQHFIRASPVVTKSGIVITAGTTSYTVYAFNTSNGALLWSWYNKNRGLFRTALTLSTDETRLYVGDNVDTMHCFAVDPAAPQRELWAMKPYTAIYSQAVLIASPPWYNAPKQNLIFGADDQLLYILDPITGAVDTKSTFKHGKIHSACSSYINDPSATDANWKQDIFTSTTTGVVMDVVRDPQSDTKLKRRWTFDTASGTSGQHLLVPDTFTAAGQSTPRHLYIVGTSGGSVYCFDSNTGDVLFELDNVGAGINDGEPLLINDTMIFATTAGNIYAYSLAAALAAGHNNRANAEGSVTSDFDSDSGSGGLNKTVIIVIVVSGCFAAIAAVLAALWFKQRQEQRAVDAQPVPVVTAVAMDPVPVQQDPRLRQRPAATGPPPQRQAAVEERENRLYEDPPAFTEPVPPRGHSDNNRTAQPAPVAVNTNKLSPADEEEVLLRSWRDSMQHAVQSSVSGGQITKLPWVYVRRLTREFVDPLSTTIGETSDSVFSADEFIDGVLMRFVVKVTPNTSVGHHDTMPHELRLITSMQHPNIIKVIAWSADEQTGQRCLIMRYMNHGSIATALTHPKRKDKLSALHRLYLALGTAQGLIHMHTRNILHRDVKSANVVLSDEGDAILIDFDVSCESEENIATGAPKTVGFTRQRRVFGTPGYICPQYARMFCGYGVQQEVYSYSIFLMELLTGSLASPTNDLADPTHQMLDSTVATELSQLPQFSNVQRLAQAGCSADPKQRPSLQQFVDALVVCAGGNSETIPDLSKNMSVYSAFDGNEDDESTIHCAICWEPAVDGPTRGIECSASQRHYLCKECLNNRVGTALESAGGDLLLLGCPMPGCSGRWFFSDFASLLHPQHLRAWHERSVQEARKAGHDDALSTQRMAEGSSNEVFRHASSIRQLLRPACPSCGMPFESFSGCTHVRCHIPGARAGNSGCGARFCGACLEISPCREGCGHKFMSPRETHDAWRGWRQRKVIAYLNQHCRGATQQRRLVLEAAKLDLEACGIWPVEDSSL